MKAVVALLLAALALSPRPAQARPDPCCTMDRWAAAYLRETRAPGVSGAIVEHGAVLCARGYGRTTVGGKPVNSRTNFHMASVSKPVVAIAVMQLVAQGRLRLDRPVGSVIPSFDAADKRDVTIRMLLQHRSGLGDVADYGWDHPKLGDDALARYASRVGSEPLAHPPGQSFSYSNQGFDALGAVVAKLSGTSFEQTMADRVLRPAGMASTAFAWPPPGAPSLALPHVFEGGRVIQARAYPFSREHGPSSTLQSNARDMGRFIVAVLRRSPRLLPARKWRDMWSPSPQAIYQDDPDHLQPGVRVALGWFVLPDRQGGLIVHPGQDIGFKSLLVLDPRKRFGLALMTNGDMTGADETRTGYFGFSLVEALTGYPMEPDSAAPATTSPEVAP